MQKETIIENQEVKINSNCEIFEGCPVTTTLNVIGGKWKPLILWTISEQTVRFGELRNAIPGITQKMLTQQLRELEADGIIDRKVYPVVPPKVEYRITEYGQSLNTILNAMADWGYKHQRVVG
jgi:DNA-binding HxlR family transcriptional regulator